MNNKKTSSRYIQIFAGAWLVALTLFVMSFVLKTDTPPSAQYFLGIFIIGIAIVFAAGGFHYIEIESHPEFLRIKHFNLFPVGREYKALEIPWTRYHTHEVKSHLGGLFHYLYLFEQTGRGMARYPSIGFTSLKKSERIAILEFLSSIDKSKQG